MVEFTHVIKEEPGLHARPAGLIAKKAKELGTSITIVCGDKSCDATKLIRLMGLEALTGDTLTIRVEGPEEAALADAFRSFLEDVV
jgi:phosphocarrier protein